MCDFLVVYSKKKFKVAKYLDEVVKRRKRLKEDEHGWGFYFESEENKVLIKEPQTAWKSSLFLWLERQEILAKANFLMLHVRKATRGRISWFNTHPFTINVKGKTYVFAHKGDISSKLDELPEPITKPFGETDSERFFLSAVKLIEENNGLPDALDELKELSDRIGDETRLNYFLYDGEYLVVYDGKDSEPLYYRRGKKEFIAASEEFKTDTMGEVGLRRIIMVKDGSIVKILEE